MHRPHSAKSLNNPSSNPLKDEQRNSLHSMGQHEFHASKSISFNREIDNTSVKIGRHQRSPSFSPLKSMQNFSTFQSRVPKIVFLISWIFSLRMSAVPGAQRKAQKKLFSPLLWRRHDVGLLIPLRSRLTSSSIAGCGLISVLGEIAMGWGFMISVG